MPIDYRYPDGEDKPVRKGAFVRQKTPPGEWFYSATPDIFGANYEVAEKPPQMKNINEGR